MKIVKCHYDSEKKPAIVTVLKTKKDGFYKFINLTRQHICTCDFKTEEEAWEDLDKCVENGSVSYYTVIGEITAEGNIVL